MKFAVSVEGLPLLLGEAMKFAVSVEGLPLLLDMSGQGIQRQATSQHCVDVSV